MGARHAADGLSDADLNLGYDGLLALADPLRPAISACVAQCRQAGIRVVVITGDHPDTAHAIALQAGLDDTLALRVLPCAVVAGA